MIEQAEKDPAQVLEDAADLLLVRGVRRDGSAGVYGPPDGPLCAYGAIVTAAEDVSAEGAAIDAVEVHLFGDVSNCDRVFRWNDETVDDFEVIDTLRHVAKDLRNEAVQ